MIQLQFILDDFFILAVTARSGNTDVAVEDINSMNIVEILFHCCNVVL
jgi:hypothetical protein